MVGTEGRSEALARVSVVNYNGAIVYDKYVRPDARVTDYRTWVSGITPPMLRPENGAITFKQAKADVHKMLNQAKAIVGHSLQHDFKSLMFDESQGKSRDVAKYAKYKSSQGQAKSLKNLSKEFLGKVIQEGSHSSVVDARAALGLYRIVEKEWENHVKQKSYNDVRKRAEQDVKQIQTMSKFLGKKPTR